MEEDLYSGLCNHLNEYPLWAPPTAEFLEILRIMFTPEEAELALGLTLAPESARQIADRAHKDTVATLQLLRRMVEKGLLLKDPNCKSEERFALLPTALRGERSPSL